MASHMGPPLLFLWRKGDVKKALKLFKWCKHHFWCIGWDRYTLYCIRPFFYNRKCFRPLSSVEFMEKAYPTTWVHFPVGVRYQHLCRHFQRFIQEITERAATPLGTYQSSNCDYSLYSDHLGPWRTPSAIFFEIMDRVHAVRTGSVYTAIVVHATLGQMLAFTDNPQTTAHGG